MTWQIDFSKESLKFIQKNNINEIDVINDLNKVIKKFKGENVNVDICKMKGDWKGFYRLREGKKRIIFKIYFDEHTIFIDRIDFRGKVYK
jgi:mRNA interferase RelE/StbE